MGLRMHVTTRQADVETAWLKVSWKAGAALGGTYLGILCLHWHASLLLTLTGIVFGGVLGIVLGTFAGLVTGTLLGLLTRPLALHPGSRFARARAAVIAVAATELICLPAQYPFDLTTPFIAILLPTIPSLLVAAIVATRIAPAGRIGTPGAEVRIQTL